MVEAEGSLTAKAAAASRAIESERPLEERLFYDPYADLLAGKEGREFLAKIGSNAPGQSVAPLRTRYTDDQLRMCLAEGIRQMVIMGAGYDARALRIEELQEGVRVFEVDHPATSRQKRQRVIEILGKPPAHVAYLEADFLEENLGSLGEKLLANGYQARQPAVFIFEGVFGYLNAEAADRLLRFLSSFAGAGSLLIFDYTDVGKKSKRFAQLLTELETIKERRDFGFDPEALPTYLEERGYRQVANASTDELMERYCPNRPRPPQTYYVAMARVYKI